MYFDLSKKLPFDIDTDHPLPLLITNTLLKFQVVTILPFKMAVAQMPKFHALSVIQDPTAWKWHESDPLYVCELS